MRNYFKEDRKPVAGFTEYKLARPPWLQVAGGLPLAKLITELESYKWPALATTKEPAFGDYQRMYVDKYKTYTTPALWQQDIIVPPAELRKAALLAIEQVEQALGAAWGISANCVSGVIAKLPSGASILPHVDEYDIHRWDEKVHIPLVTNDACFNTTFSLDAEPLTATHLLVGGAYAINNLIPHGAYNYGEQDRIHLILDIVPTDCELKSSEHYIKKSLIKEFDSFNFYKKLAKRLWFKEPLEVFDELV
jgi:Aspartyl/Asparaginyl beta-hydroxylase